MARLVASKLDKETVCRHLHLVSQEVDSNEWNLIEGMRHAAINYVCDQCAITAEEVDTYEDLAIAVLMLIADLYDNRDMTSDKPNPNRTVETILAHHDHNFLGEAGE